MSVTGSRVKSTAAGSNGRAGGDDAPGGVAVGVPPDWDGVAVAVSPGVSPGVAEAAVGPEDWPPVDGPQAAVTASRHAASTPAREREECMAGHPSGIDGTGTRGG